MIYTVSFNPSLDYVQDLDCCESWICQPYQRREDSAGVEKESMYPWY